MTMTPKPVRADDDDLVMTINFRSKRRVASECAHESQIRTEIAGLSREVCESCGRVSVGYVGNHFSYAEAAEEVSDGALS